KASRSAVRQAIGRAEEMERQGRLGLSPEVVVRYRGAIVLIEDVRSLIGEALHWLLWPARRFESVFRSFENSLVVRVVVLAGELAGGAALIILVVSAVT